MNIYSLSVLLFSFGVLLIAILAFAKRKDIISIRFGLFSIGVCGWGFLYSIWTSQPYDPKTLLFLIRLSEVFAVFIPIAWLHFVLDFIGRKEPFKHFYLINYSIAVILALLCPTPYFFTGVHEVPIFRYYKTAGPVFYVFLLLFFVLVPYAFYHLALAYKQTSGNAKIQLRFLIIGWMISFIAGGTTFLPVFKVTFQLPLLFLMPLYPILIGIPLIRYGLFDYQQIADAFQREKLAAIGIMAASLNHELRNPLYIAKGNIESYLDGAQRGLYPSINERASKADSTLLTSLAQLTRAMEIMQRFSDFAKPFNDKKDRETVILGEVFNDVLQLVSNEFAMHKIKVNYHPTNGLDILANRRQMEEILFNLVINACHAMSDEGGELGLRAYQPNGKVIVEISDTGPGIAKESVRRIFEPFYSTKGEKGSGLGLYITKQLVERNGGKISVKSKPGEGTAFVLEFKK